MQTMKYRIYIENHTKILKNTYRMHIENLKYINN